MKEYKIGYRVKVSVPVVKYKEVEVEVCEGVGAVGDCERCAFYSNDPNCRSTKCGRRERSDHKDVYFKLIEQ